MAGIGDGGNDHHVLYLGSSPLPQIGTGIGALQKPLRDLYFRYREVKSGRVGQERTLNVSDKGLIISYWETASSPPTTVTYNMNNIISWDAVQFIMVRATKRVMGAFEPLDNNHSRNKDNLFAAVEKRFLFLQQMSHPAMFACVLRRPQGVRALEVHAFICASQEEALSLVRAISTLHAHSQADDVQETGVFGYKPFQQKVPGRPRNPSSRAASVRTNASPGEGDPASATQIHEVNKRQRSPLESDHHVSSSYQLSQNDFEYSQSEGRNQLHSTREPEHVYSLVGQSPQSAPLQQEQHPNLSTTAVPAPKTPVRDYHIYVKPVAAQLDKESNKPRIQRSVSASNKADHNVITSPANKSKSPRVHRRNSPIVKKRDSPVELLRQQHTDKLGQGYSLLTGSGSNLPGQPDRGYPNYDYYDDVPTRDYVDENYGQDSLPGYDRHRHERRQYFEEDEHEYHSGRLEEHRSQIRYTDPPFHNRNSAAHEGYDQNRRQLEHDGRLQRHTERDDPYAIQDEYDYQERAPSPLSKSRYSQDRPVAKVPPHKVTGIKVLPIRPNEELSRGHTPSPPLSKSYEHEYSSKSAMFDDLEYTKPPPSTSSSSSSLFGSGKKPPKSEYFDDEQYIQSPERTHERPKRGKQTEANWQFRSNSESDNQRNNQKNRGDSSINEKLLMTQKKDAEIASVMHNLHLDGGKNFTMTPGVPAGNNFEKSLGYFP